ncbi:inner membrane protein involved in colicin E2 resistance [Elusimicrobium posterum]|uniref:hypothetical protein n=1 Tax=Elusimicrobium posterum TaxID=3116653 RepID=UPI003C71B345
MKALVILLIMLALGGLVGFGLEYSTSALFGGKIASFFAKGVTLGVNALALRISVAGGIGVAISYVVIYKILKF